LSVDLDFSGSLADSFFGSSFLMNYKVDYYVAEPLDFLPPSIGFLVFLFVAVSSFISTSLMIGFGETFTGFSTSEGLIIGS
jgi:hypothetical protein